MAWRFKVSKYKNSAPKFLKKEENILDIPVSDVTQSCGNHIKASCVYVAFNVDSGGGGNLGYLPLSASGRQGASLPIIPAHGDFVTDLDFSPFDDYLLATGSQDNKVKVWLLPDETSGGEVSELLTLPVFERRVENVLWNPVADGILAVSCNTCVSVYDVARAQSTQISAISDHGDQIQSISWDGYGKLLATSCRDKKMRVVDLRANSVVQVGDGHQNVKDSRVLWLPGKDFMLSTGFSQSRSRELRFWDPRNLSSCLSSMDLDSSTGTVMPFFDPDTNMTFLLGKGDNALNFLEFTDKDPYLTPAGLDRTEQIKGAAMVPKRAMNLMDGEVNRLMVLCKNSIIPVPYIVPRKSYRDFHSDIFPDTRDGIPTLTSEQWIQGQDGQPTFIKLEPGKALVHRNRRGALITGSVGEEKATPQSATPTIKPTPSTGSGDSKPQQPASTTASPQPTNQSAPKPSPASPPVNANQNQATVSSPAKVETTQEAKPEKPAVAPERPKIKAKPFAGVRQSKYRHIQGHTLHPSSFITNVRNVSKTVPGEGNMFAANVTRCAVPIDGAGGCLQVFELSSGTRLPDAGVPNLQNGSKVNDLAWDPFDDSRLVVALDNAKINVWRIPDGGLTETLTEPEFSLRGHMEKMYFVQFHPLASDIIISAAYDMTVRLWDLKERKEVMQLSGHGDQVFCLAWSADGVYCATVCKDGKVRIFDPRKSPEPIREGPGPEGSRGARVVWAMQDKYLVVSGFDKQSLQQLLIYKVSSLELLHTLEIAVSPVILIPHYDPDSSVIYLSSRGERTMYTVEVADDSPHLFECAPYKLETLHQAVSFLPKSTCDVRKVEVARAWRLTLNSVEALSFTVPRVKPEYFQDDLFPDTEILWKPTLTGAEWLAGTNKKPAKMSLRPSDMKPLSEAPVEAPKAKKFESYNEDTFKTDEQRKDELLNAMVGKLEISSDPLPQDLAEGVDDDEWDD